MRLKITKKTTAVMMCALAICSLAPAMPVYAQSRTHVSSRYSNDQDKMRAVAAQVQAAYERQDLDKLADLCSYPLAVVYGDGTLLNINGKADFKALGAAVIFSQKMRDSITSTNVAKLENGDMAGVQMGGDNGLSLFKIKGKWQVNSFYLDTAKGGYVEAVNISSLPEMAQQIQKIFSYQDLDTLSRMCNYPVAITSENNTTVEINTPAQLIAMGEKKVFTDKVSKAIDQVDVNKLQEVGDAGVQMGGDSGLNMYKFNGYWKINQIYQ